MANKMVMLINGPNLNLLGQRDKSLYGGETLPEIVSNLKEKAKDLLIDLHDFQSNSEGDLVTAIQDSIGKASAIIINPGALTHTSIAIRDALECFKGAVIEVHLSNIYAREEFRRHSYISGVATGVISGLGPKGYELALYAVP